MRFFPATLILLMILSGSAAAAPLEGDAAIEAGKKSFTTDKDLPWYDAPSDSVDPLKLQPPQQQQQQQQQQQSSSANQSDLSWLYQLLQILGWTALAMILGAIVFLMIRANTAGNALDMVDESVPQHAIDPERVEELPFKLEKPEGDLYSTAQHYYRSGEFDKAIIYLYSHMLLELDHAQVIRLSRGKTNRQYLRETKRGSAAGPLLEQTIIAFEDTFFGHHDLSRERFENCWNSLPQFKTLLHQSPSEAGLVPA